MVNKGKFIVPESERIEYDRLVQRANRRIQRNIKYSEDFTSDVAKRNITGGYDDKTKWVSDKTVFSRSKVFESEKDYQQYKRHLEKWGASGTYEKSLEALDKAYYKSIIKALTTTAIDNGNGVLYENGQLPRNLAKKIKDLTLEQKMSFFDGGDPTEDIEANGWDSWDYIGVDRDEFVDITEAHINKLKGIVPSDNYKPLATQKPKKKKPNATAKKTISKSKKKTAKKKKKISKKTIRKVKKIIKKTVKGAVKNVNERAITPGQPGSVKHGKALQPPKNKTIKNFNQD